MFGRKFQILKLVGMKQFVAKLYTYIMNLFLNIRDNLKTMLEILLSIKMRTKQLFRESFKVAGDDILLQIIRDYSVKSIENSACDLLKSKSQKEKDRIHSKMVDLLGQDRATQQDEQSRTLRKQLTTQLFEPF